MKVEPPYLHTEARYSMQSSWPIARLTHPDADRDAIDLDRLIAGDPAAFRTFYDRYAPEVFWYLRSRIGSPEEAADLTQEVFLRCHQALPRYRDRGAPLRAWLFRIVRNLAIDDARRRERERSRDSRAGAVFSEPIAPEAAVLQGEEAADLHALIAQLDLDKQDLLALHYAAGLSIAEIAAVRGMGQWAVRKRLQRIVHTLRKAYTASGRTKK